MFKNFLKIKIKTINIFLLNTFVFIVLNLNIIYNLTFILSFGITFNIFLLNNIFKKLKNNFLKEIILSILIFLIANSYILIFQNYINILGLFFQFLFLPILFFSYLYIGLFFYFEKALDLYFLILKIIIFELKKLTIEISIVSSYYYFFWINFILIFLNYLLTNHFH
ncbi:hypothetical protein FJM01_02500 [Mycoplasma struthionis]|uniref:Uncharacterized protein n=1 Tax=Mycoplasma struthionis TaxID=538220 RepID=A0A502M1N9_9MOLU|nr:hypothetical protein FJM01_02500 [Mycoplasma struthionis]